MRQTAAEVLVEEYRPLVRWTAQKLKRRVSHRAEIDDLMQAGMEGLLKAAPRFSAQSGASFETFIGYSIRGAMIDSLREYDWAPRSIPRASRKIAEVMRAIEIEKQRPARETEIAERLELSLADYQALLQDTARHYVSSMDEAPQAMEAITPSDPEGEIADWQERERINAALATLPERERYIIEQTYLGECTLLDVAKKLGIHESRACQLRTSAVARLQAALL